MVSATAPIKTASSITFNFRSPCSTAIILLSPWRDIMKPTKRKTARRIANRVKGISVSDPEYLTQSIEPFDGVWSGEIARLRFYASQQWVQAFLAPGNNNNLIGTTSDPP
jgi:hypothetical protein